MWKAGDGVEDTISVREGEELNVEKLELYLQSEIPGLPAAPLTIKQFPSGHSNLTYSLQIGDWEAVLRRPPLGPVAPKAHDMQREYTVLKELHSHFPLAPKPYLFTADTSLVGNPFFVMERRHGVVLDTDFPPGVSVTPELCRSLSQTMVKELVRLHEVDYQATGLAQMTRPEGFMERQVQGWIGRYQGAKTDEVKGIDSLMQWLANHTPAESGSTVIHYDYKFNNAMFSDDLSSMVGLFDWEMTTVGDPLADLGAAMSYWIEAADPELLKYGLGKPPITVQEGFFTRREFIEAYARESGRDVSHIHFYVTFAYFKLAVIVQQIYYRYKAGQTRDPRFAHMDKTVHSLVQYALEMTNPAQGS